MAELPFTIPVIRRGTFHWWVEYKFRNPFNKEKWDRFRLYGKINAKKYAALKEWNAEQLRSELEDQLKQGKVPSLYKNVPPELQDQWLPQAAPVSRVAKVAAQIQTPALTTTTPPMASTYKGDTMLMWQSMEKIAVSQALGKSQDTLNANRMNIGRLRKFYITLLREDAIENGKEFTEDKVDQLFLSDFDQEKAQEFRDYLISDMDLANPTVNTTIDTLKRFFKVCHQLKQIPSNPFEFVQRLPTTRGTTFTPFTTEEKDLIIAHLRKHHPELNLFANLIYSCFIRPRELCDLMPSDIDLKRELIQVRSETAKGKHTSSRYIMPATMELLKSMKVVIRPAGEPIFSAICGNDKSLRKRRQKVTVLWNKVVINTLGIKKEMYGLKHTGNVDYLKSLDSIDQADVNWLKAQNDHTDFAVTQKYIQSLGVTKLNKENIKHGKW